MKKIFSTPLKILAFMAICSAVAVVLLTGGWGIGMGLLMLIVALLLYLINYIASKTKYVKAIQIWISVVCVLMGFYFIMKWQEHTIYIFSKTSKEAIGIVFGIEGYPALPATFFWTKTIRMPESGVIVTSTKEEDMPKWQRYQFSDGSVLETNKINWNPNFQFPCIKTKGVVKAWLFNTPGQSDSLAQKRIVEIVNRIDAGQLKTCYSSLEGLTVVNAKKGNYISLQGLNLAYLPDAISTLPINTIYLAENKFTSIPHQLYEIKTLRTIYLSANPIRSLPGDLWKIKGLRSLMLGKTEIRDIKTDLSSLDSLEDFDISGNKLSVFPENIKSIPHLKCLSVENNEIKDLSFIDSKLSKLQTLQVYSNKIKRIPDNIRQLKNLKELLIFDNQIDSIPNSIGSLVELEHLEIWNNPIRYISPEVQKLVKLKEMRLDDNNLSEKDKEQLRRWLPKCEIHFQTRAPLN